MTCTICRRPGTPRHTARGDVYSVSCDACEPLAWQEHWHRVTNAEPWEWATHRWEVRRHLAQLDGRVFLEPAPTMPGELAVAQVAVDSRRLRA